MRKVTYLALFLVLLLTTALITNCGPVKFSQGPKNGVGPKAETQCLNPGCDSKTILNSMGLVTDHVKCVLCHINIRGDLAATASSPFDMHPGSLSAIYGNVKTNYPIVQHPPGNGYGTNADPAHIIMQGEYEVISGVAPNQVWNSVGICHQAHPWAPCNPEYDITIANPALNFVFFDVNRIKASINSGTGTLTQNGSTIINKIYSGNLVIDAKSSPAVISGEVYVTGDLIIRGQFSGVGTIYVEKNIFVPDDILVSGSDTLFSQFAQATTQSAADQIAVQAINSNAPALRLAAKGVIFIGHPGKTTRSNSEPLPPDTRLKNYFLGTVQSEYMTNPNYNTQYQSYYTGETFTSTDDINGKRSRSDMIDNFLLAQKNEIGLDPNNDRLKVFNWYPNYFSLLKPEYELSSSNATKVCGGSQYRVGMGSVARIDATLYGQEGVAGVMSSGGNIIINGGVVTQRLGLLAGTGWNLYIMSDLRSRTVYEYKKNCAGGGTWMLDRNTVNPENGIAINMSEIRYDYRLRNQGAGFNAMRSADYLASNYNKVRSDRMLASQAASGKSFASIWFEDNVNKLKMLWARMTGQKYVGQTTQPSIAPSSQEKPFKSMAPPPEYYMKNPPKKSKKH